MKPAYLELLDQIRNLGREPMTVGRTFHEFEVVYVKTGGGRSPPVLLAAGSHADEPSGVLAALRLLGELQTDRSLTIIPCRDPVGWCGYRYWLERSLGEPWPLECPPARPERAWATCHRAAGAILRQRGTILYDDGDLVVARLGLFAFAYRALPGGIHGSTGVMEALGAALERSERLVEVLRWSRVLLPALMPGESGCGCFDRAYSVFIDGRGQMGNLNRFFDRSEILNEVDRARDIILATKPGLSLDLHEGFGDGFYLFVPPEITDNPICLQIGRRMTDEVRRAGFRLTKLAEIQSHLTQGNRTQMEDLGEGLIAYGFIRAGRPTTFSGFCRQFGPAFTVEVGMRRPLAERIEMQSVAVRAALQASEDCCRRHQGRRRV